MAKQSFLLVSLQEDKAKKLAQVITNESCRKILDYLAEKEGTETELAENLKLPISTVHYNLKQLAEAGLVSAEEYHYSKKGKEVNHYKLANKYIIIAPKSTFGIKEKLRSILPAVLIVSAIGFIMEFFSKYDIKTNAAAREAMLQKASSTAAQSEALQPQLQTGYLWIIGIISTIILYLAFEYLHYKKSANK